MEIGISHLGHENLYGELNRMPGVWCERVFAPWLDMEEQLRQNQLDLYALKAGDSLRNLILVLHFNMSSATAMLNMLELGGVPLCSRTVPGLSGIVVAGGPCACNPEPMADFIDLFFIGKAREGRLRGRRASSAV